MNPDILSLGLRLEVWCLDLGLGLATQCLGLEKNVLVLVLVSVLAKFFLFLQFQNIRLEAHSVFRGHFIYWRAYNVDYSF